MIFELLQLYNLIIYAKINIILIIGYIYRAECKSMS